MRLLTSFKALFLITCSLHFSTPVIITAFNYIILQSDVHSCYS